MREEHDIFHAASVDEEIEQAESQQPGYQQPVERFSDHSTDDRVHIVQMLRTITQQESQNTMDELNTAWQRIVTSHQYETNVQSEQAEDTIKHAVPVWNAQPTVLQRGKTSRTIETIPSVKQRSRRMFSILAAVACIALVIGSMLWIENKIQTSRVASNQHNGKNTPTATPTSPLPKLTYTYKQTGESDISSLRWSPLGNRLLSVGDTIRIWDFKQTFLSLNNPDRSSFTHTVWSPDGKSIAINNLNTGIEIRNAATGQLQRTCASPTTSNRQSQPGANIQSNQQPLLSARAPSILQSSDSAGGYFNLAWSPDGKYLAASFYPPGANSFTYPFVGVVVYSTVDCSIAWQPTAAKGWDDLIEWSPDSKYLVLSSSMDHGIDIIDFATKQIVHTYTYDATVKGSSYIGALSWSPDGKKTAMYESDGTGGFISISDALTSAHKVTFREVNDIYSQSDYSWSPDSKYIVSISTEIRITRTGTTTKSTICILDATTGKVIYTFAGNAPASAVAWSPDGDYIAISYDGTTDSSSSNSTKDATVAVWHVPHW